MGAVHLLDSGGSPSQSDLYLLLPIRYSSVSTSEDGTYGGAPMYHFLPFLAL